MINVPFETLNYGAFANLLSLSEAAEIWGIDESTIRKAIACGKIKPGIDCRKFGKQWVVTAHAMRRVFAPFDTTWADFLHDIREKDLHDTGNKN